MPVGLMLRSMCSAELTEWMAYFDLKANPPKEKQSAAEIKSVLDSLTARSGFRR